MMRGLHAARGGPRRERRIAGTHRLACRDRCFTVRPAGRSAAPDMQILHEALDGSPQRNPLSTSTFGS
jgi:hypothetical protein